MKIKKIYILDWLVKHKTKSNYLDVDAIKTTLNHCGIKPINETSFLYSANPIYGIAETLINLKLDQASIIAGIIYIYLTENSDQIKTIASKIDPNILLLINSINYMSIIDKQTAKENKNPLQLENIHKMLISILDDPRVAIIKLAEQIVILQNMIMNKNQDVAHAKQIYKIYVPLANRLGMGQIKSKLEDLTLSVTHPEIYDKINSSLQDSQTNREMFIKQKMALLNSLLKKHNITNFDVYGRPKHISSIYSKMQRKNISLEKIYDVIAIRVHVPTIRNCYEVLSIIHQKWQHIAKEFDDYIVNPKSNGYKSLHTAVVDNKKRTFEVQIRTFQMHEEAEYGIAAHWYYKQGGNRHILSEKKANWLKQVLSWHENILPKNSPQNKMIVDDRIYVFTPDGDIIDLPKDATPIDFAYRIHSAVGNKCKGAKLNGKIIPLNHKLQTGDKIEIITSNSAHPTTNWLVPKYEYVKTSKAKSHITKWLSQNNSNITIVGKELLEKIAKKNNIKLPNLEQLANRLHCKTINKFYLALENGEIKQNQLIEEIDKINRKITPAKNFLSKAITALKQQQVPPINLHGLDQILTHYAKCCNPTIHDQIVGFISKDHGIYIHKATCENILKKKPEEQSRIIYIKWNEKENKTNKVIISVKIKNKPNLLHKISSFISQYTSSFQLIATEKVDSDIFVYNLYLEIVHLSKLATIIKNLYQIDGVIEAKTK